MPFKNTPKMLRGTSWRFGAGQASAACSPGGRGGDGGGVSASFCFFARGASPSDLLAAEVAATVAVVADVPDVALAVPAVVVAVPAVDVAVFAVRAAVTAVPVAVAGSGDVGMDAVTPDVATGAVVVFLIVAAADAEDTAALCSEAPTAAAATAAVGIAEFSCPVLLFPCKLLFAMHLLSLEAAPPPTAVLAAGSTTTWGRMKARMPLTAAGAGAVAAGTVAFTVAAAGGAAAAAGVVGTVLCSALRFLSPVRSDADTAAVSTLAAGAAGVRVTTDTGSVNGFPKPSTF